jgi:hypothetical protein
MEKLRNLHAKYVVEMTERNTMAQKKLEALHKEDWETAQQFVGLQCYHQGRAEVFAELLKEMGVVVNVGSQITALFDEGMRQ